MRQPFGEPEHRHLFRDRTDAGARLAERLAAYRGQNAVVFGIPRGGVIVAVEVARRLDADLDVIVARKLGSPISPELAIGAVTANGGRFLNDEIIRELEVGPEFLAEVTARERAEAQRREERFRGPYATSDTTGRVAIIVDDGLATGATMRAAVRSLRQRQPARLIVAVPVGSRQACLVLAEEADEVVCLYQPEPFWAVGLYYEHFEPVQDATVEAVLQEYYAARRQPRAQVS